MPKPLQWFLDKELLLKDNTVKNLAYNYLEKSKNNIITMELLTNVTNFRDILKLPENYYTEEWIVIAAYYSMYMAALAILAKLGYKSKNHSATIAALEEFFVKKELLEKKYLKSFEKIKIKKEDVEKISLAKDRREIAQYSVTKETTKNLAEETKKDAHNFVNRIEELFDVLE